MTPGKKPAGANDPFIDCISRNVMITMQIKMTSYRILPVIAATIIIMCVVCTGGAFAAFITIPGAETGQVADSTLANTGWQLVSYTSGNAQVPVATGSKITLKFNGDGSIGGSGGINLYFGSYTQNGNSITFGPLGCTEMAGPEPLMDQESRYFSLLDSTRTSHATESTLELSDASDRIVLVFRSDNSGSSNGPAVKNPATVLPGTEWQLSSYSDGTTVVSGQDIRTITMKFNDAGNLSGFGGVNSYFGSYTLDGEAISIGPLASTKMAGPEPLMTLESTYLNLLNSVTGVTIAGDSLSLADNEGNIVVTFEPKTTAQQGRYTAFIPTGTSHSFVPPATGGQFLTTIKDRFSKTGSWIGSTGRVPVKWAQQGKGTVTVPVTGKNQRPLTMPRINDSVIAPVTYPGGPLL
ncbi:MAG: META domain-containing protein [Methanomicrobiales archaeon]